MDKVLVEINIPMAEITYNVWLPTNRRIYNIINLLIKSIRELNNNCVSATAKPLLYDELTSEPYDINLTIKDTNIRNGSKLILI